MCGPKFFSPCGIMYICGFATVRAYCSCVLNMSCLMAGAGVCPNMISGVQFLLNQDPGRCHAKCPRVQTHCKFRVFNTPVYKRASEALRDFLVRLCRLKDLKDVIKQLNHWKPSFCGLPRPAKHGKRRCERSVEHTKRFLCSIFS